MTSAFTVSKIALAQLGVAATHGAGGAIVVGGLRLGYTARAVVYHGSVSSPTVVEFLAPVIEWHQEGLLPLGRKLCDDKRCRFVQGDFFAMAESQDGFDPDAPGRRFHAILVNIDHSPAILLDDRSQSFYRPDGLRALGRHLTSGGVFGLWSSDRPDEQFLHQLRSAFEEACAEPVTFHNPLQDRPFTQTVYLARTAGGGA